MSLIMIGAFLVFLVAAVPIAISMGSAAVVAVISSQRFPIETVFHTMVSGLTSYILLSIPFLSLLVNL